jgi:hypothetical protein
MMDLHMRVFISWSREQSRAVALVLRDWLPDVIQGIESWVSQADIRAGERWNNGLNESLRAANFGILCITRENLNQPWLLFEAGALARSFDDPFVCPYLIDVEPRDLLESPLAQFQGAKANEEGTRNLVRSINLAANSPLAEAKLFRAFDKWWPDLARKLGELGIRASVEQVAHEALASARRRSQTTNTDSELAILEYMARAFTPKRLQQILASSGDTPPELLEIWFEQLNSSSSSQHK